MNSYEQILEDEKNELLKKIEKLKEEKKRLEDEPIKATSIYDYIDDIRVNSDTGKRENFGKTYGVREVPAWEVKENRIKKIQRINQEIEEMYVRIRQINNELFKIEWDKPENVTKRQQKAVIKSKEEQKQQLQQERVEHEERYDDLNKLVEYLEIAGLHDLASIVSELRFAFQKSKSDYINEEINLQSKEKTFNSRTQTTKKEYKEIKRSVIRLSKNATRNAKKYKDLYNLYLHAWKIVRDIEEKGISKMQGDSLCQALKNYFTQPTGEYLFSEHGNYYNRKESENLGYQYLAFYRDYASKYNEDKRKHRIY